MTEKLKITQNNRTINGVFYIPEGMSEFPAVILSHGYNSTFDAFSAAGEYFASRGIGAAAFNFCGGSLSDTSGFPTTGMTLTTEKEDLLAVYDYLASTAGVSRVFLFGSSQGGMISALAAEELSGKIGGLMLQYPALCIPDDWRGRYPDDSDIPDTAELWGMSLGRAFITEARSMDLSKAVGAYSGNVLIMHGGKDDIVPLHYSEWAAGRYKHARLELFPEEGHGFSEKESARMNKMCADFIRDNMR